VALFCVVEILVHVFVLVKKIGIWDMIGILSFEIWSLDLGFGFGPWDLRFAHHWLQHDALT